MIGTARSTDAGLDSGPLCARGIAVVGVGIAALVFGTLRPLLVPGANVLPGTDAGNLYAWELYARSVFAIGRLPHWNPFLFAGTPHLADSETTVLYPPALLLRWIPPVPFFSWMVAFHMCVAGIGTAFLARVIGLGWTAAAAAAIAVTLGGSIPAWIFNGHLLLIFATAWLPWILGLVIYSARRPTVWPHPALVIVFIVQFLAGYLQGTIYVAAAAVLCVICLAAVPPAGARAASRLRPVWQLGIAGFLAAGIAAFQLLPTLALVGEAARTSGVPYSTAVRGGWALQDLATFLFPFAGIPLESRMRFMGDHTAYVGWVLVLATPFAFADRHHRRIAVFFGVLATGCIAFVMAGALPFYRLHYLLFPGLRIPGRMLFMVTLAAAMLGAIGLDWLMRHVSSRSRPAARAVGFVLLVLVAGDVLRFSRGAVQPTSPDPAPALFSIPPGSGRTLSVCDRALGPMDLVIGGRAAADGTGGGMLRDYSAFQELALEDGPLRLRRDLLDLSNVTTVVTCTPLEVPGFREVGHAGVGIVYRNDAAWPRASWACGAEPVTRREAVDHLRGVRYDAQRHLDRRYFVNIRWAAPVGDGARGELESRYHLADGVRRDGTTWRYDLQDRSAANIQKLLGDAAVEDTAGINRETADLSSGEARDQVLVGTASCAQTGTITGLAADRPGGDVTLVSEAPTNGLVFLSEPYYPERVAYVDNVAVTPLKADVAFTAVPVPAGRHVVELRYVPRQFQAGLAVSGVTLVAWGAAAWWLPRRRRSSSTSAAA